MAALALVATYIKEVEKDGCCFDRTRKKDNVQKIKFIEIPRDVMDLWWMGNWTGEWADVWW